MNANTDNKNPNDLGIMIKIFIATCLILLGLLLTSYKEPTDAELVDLDSDQQEKMYEYHTSLGRNIIDY